MWRCEDVRPAASMCLTACYYAGIRRIVFGASIRSLDAVTENELCVDSTDWLPAESGFALTGGLLEEDAEALIAQWQSLMQGRRA